jgi:hypothetical protein
MNANPPSILAEIGNLLIRAMLERFEIEQKAPNKKARRAAPGGRENNTPRQRLSTSNDSRSSDILQVPSNFDHPLTGRQAAHLARLMSRRPRHFARVREKLGLADKPVAALSRGEAGKLLRVARWVQ